MVGIYVRGDFYVCPNPLSFDPYSKCEWNCRYCWIKEMEETILRKSSFKLFDVKSLERTLRNAFSERYPSIDPVIEALRAKLPVLIGRKCEPFGPSEKIYGATRKALEIFDDYGVTAIIETKGVERVFETVSKFEKVGVLISVIPGPESLRRVLEPEAPSFEERFRLARALRESGVWVGLTAEPIISSVNDRKEYFEEYLNRAREARVNHVNFGGYRLHKPKLAYERLKAAGVDLLEVVKAKRDWRSKGLEFFRLAKERGLAVSSPEWDLFYEENSCVSCCGLDEFGYHKFNFQYALKILKEKGKVSFSDVTSYNVFGPKFLEKFERIWEGDGIHYNLRDAVGVQCLGRDQKGRLVFGR